MVKNKHLPVLIVLLMFGSLEVLSKLNEDEGLIKEILFENVNNIESFDGEKFNEVFQEISKFKQQVPIKERFMKEEEYQLLLTDFQKDLENEEVFKLEIPIEVGQCDIGIFCFSPDYEVFSYLVYDKDYPKRVFEFNRQIDSELAEGATVLQQNFGKSSKFTILNTSKDELIVSGMNNFFVLPKILQEICIKKPQRCFKRGKEHIFQNLNQVKNDFDNYKAYIIFKVNYKNQENRQSISSTPATISSPLEKNITTRKIYALLQGLYLEYDGINILESGNFNVLHKPYHAGQPIYPKAAKKKKLSGSATVSFIYNPKESKLKNIKFIEGFCAKKYDESQKVLLDKYPCDVFKKNSLWAAEKLLVFHSSKKSPIKEVTLYHTYEFFYEDNI